MIRCCERERLSEHERRTRRNRPHKQSAHEKHIHDPARRTNHAEKEPKIH